MEVTIPDHQAALANLPDEPDPVTLPALMGWFFQTDDMDTEAPGNHTVPPATTTTAATQDATTDALPPHTEVVTPITKPQGVPLPTAVDTRMEALTTFLAAPRLRDPTKI